MIITHISLKQENITLRTPFVTALRRVEYIENIVVTLHTDTPFIAQGAAPATKAITGEDLETISQTIRNVIAPALIHQSFELDTLVQLTQESCQGNSSAKAAIEMALYDLAAKVKHQSLVSFLGGEASELKTAVTVSLNDSDTMAEDAKKAYDRGFDILKIKVGGGDTKDIERIVAIREAVPKAELLIDANQAWSVDESLQIIHAIEHLDIALIEQPVNGKDIEGLKTVTQHSAIPILADEAVFTLYDAKKVIEQEAANMINIKLMKCGGISKAIEIITYAQRNGVKCMMGSMLEGPVSIKAAAQLVMAYPDAFSYIDLDSPLLYNKLPTGSGLKFFNNTMRLEEYEPYSLYILECSDGSFYTGIAKEVQKRLHEHNHSDSGAKYTHARRPVKLIYEEQHNSKYTALRREMEVKKMTRKQKERLIMR